MSTETSHLCVYNFENIVIVGVMRKLLHGRLSDELQTIGGINGLPDENSYEYCLYICIY